MFRILVLSDLHVYDGGAKHHDPSNIPSYVNMSESARLPTNDPLIALRTLVKTNRISADVLACCGDMGDKAYPSATRFAWNEIADIGRQINARSVVGAAGNHDLDSRFIYNDHDAKGVVYGLTPPFPLIDEVPRLQYWAENFVVIPDKKIRIVLLNTSAFHGFKDESQHGRVSEITISRLQERLGGKPKKINVLICHHHPYKHSDMPIDDYDVMTNGQRLLDLLGSGDYGEWLIIHGHRHYPKLTYAAGSNLVSPIVFSAGSTSAKLCPDLGTKAKNQCYLIEFNDRDVAKFGLVGRFKAWDWSQGNGWLPASMNSGLPYMGGFGYRANLKEMAKKVSSMVKTRKKWNEIVKKYVELSYVSPGDLRILIAELKRGHKVNCQPDEYGIPSELEKK